jgi:DNA-binding response OmpR family regulator
VAAHPRPPTTPRLLLVEDHPALRIGLTTALERAGLHVVACSTFEEARFRLLAEDFDILVSDIRLGNFNGLQLADLARGKSPTGRIVVFSGFDDPVLRQEAVRLGATYLVKPVSIEQLLQAILE